MLLLFSYFTSPFSPPSARHYNATLSIWLSVDPMADKYPGVSPYTYCANNPVRLVDPNGREIWIVGEDGNKYQYFNGKLYTSDGEVCSVTKGSFEESVLNNLDVLRSTKIGGQIIRGLETCEDKVTISDANQRSSESGKNEFILTGTLTWISSGGSVQTTNGERCDPITNLGHELGHAYDYFVEKIPKNQLKMKINGCDVTEWRAVYYENRMRKELGLPYRTGYRITESNPENGQEKTTFTKMLNQRGEPIKIW